MEPPWKSATSGEPPPPYDIADEGLVVWPEPGYRTELVYDLRKETRFRGATLLEDHGVVSGVSVLIRGRDRPFGVLGRTLPLD